MDGIALMATAMNAAEHRLDVSAANLANVSTSGFHKQLAHVALGARGLVVSQAQDRATGALRNTGRAFDLASVGHGGFFVRDAALRTHEVRTGSFACDARGRLVDERGGVLLGLHGPVLADSSTTIDERGVVRNGSGSAVARLRLAPDTTVQSGFLEASNVDAVHEMVAVLGAERAFETAQKTLGAIDEARQKDVNDVVRVKS